MGRALLANRASRRVFFTRKMSSQRQALSSNISLVPASPLTLNKTGRGWSVVCEETRPLILLFEYMNAAPKHIDKFLEFYTDRKFDVLTVKLKPWQLFWPAKGSQVVAKDVANFVLANEKFNPIVYHGFSVGGYLWGEVLRHCKDNHPQYLPFTRRICGQIIDSGVDVNEIPTAFPKAVFPDRPLVQKGFEKFLRLQMNVFYYQSTRHYIHARAAFGDGIVRGPTLFIYSDSDPLSTRETNALVVNDLNRKAIECNVKEFKGSKHVMHYQKHKEEYLTELSNFLDRLTLSSTSHAVHADSLARLQAKL